MKEIKRKGLRVIGMLIIALSAIASYADEGDVLFHESFNKCKGVGGNDGNWFNFTWTAYITVDSCDNEGWTFGKTQTNGFSYSADSCARFGDSSFKFGYATTPVLKGLSGKAILKFKAAAWKLDSEGNTLDLSASGIKLTQNSITLTKGAWTEYTVYLTKPQTSTSPNITFKTTKGKGTKGRFFLDEIYVINVDTIDESNENEITAIDVADITLKRTLSKEYWNTFCVPFSMTEKQIAKAFGDGTKITRYTGECVDGVMKFERVTTIEAGKPYLMKPAVTVENPTISGAKTEAVDADTVGTDYKFIGTYSPKALKTDGTNLFLDTEGAMFAPTVDGKTMKGMRAYFAIPSSASSKTFSIGFTDGGETTHIDGHSMGKTKNAVKATYNLSGQRVKTNATRGVRVDSGLKYVTK